MGRENKQLTGCGAEETQGQELGTLGRNDLGNLSWNRFFRRDEGGRESREDLFQRGRSESASVPTPCSFPQLVDESLAILLEQLRFRQKGLLDAISPARIARRLAVTRLLAAKRNSPDKCVYAKKTAPVSRDGFVF